MKKSAFFCIFLHGFDFFIYLKLSFPIEPIFQTESLDFFLFRNILSLFFKIHKKKGFS